MVYYLLLCLIGIIVYVRVIGWQRVGRWDSFAGFYLAGFTLVFLIRPWYLFSAGYFKQLHQFGVNPPPDWWSWDGLLAKMGLAIILALTSFALAYRRVMRPGAGLAASALEQPDRRISPELRRGLIILALCLAAPGISSILFYHPLPGLRDVSEVHWSTLPDGSGRGFTDATGYLVHAELFTIPACVIFLLATGELLWTLLMAAPFILVRMWHGWNRQALIHLGLSLVLAAVLSPQLNREKRRLALWCTLGLLVGSMALFGVLGKERTALQSYYYEQTGPMSSYRESTVDEYLDALVGFEISLHWLKFTPEKFPYEWGSQYLYQLFILPIPRVWWPEKRNIFASSSPATHKEYVSYLWGCAPGCVGDAWRNGGWPGIIFFFALAGVLCALAQKTRTWASYPITGLILFASTYPLVITAVRDGLAALTANLYFLGIPIFLTYLIERQVKLSGYREKIRPGRRAKIPEETG